MKKGKMLNSEIISVISKMGHTDTICIADCGLPIPDHVKRIDISLIEGMPSFLDTLNALLETYECEAYTLAEEIKTKNPKVHKSTVDLLIGKDFTYISHEEFKKKLNTVKAVIRTGENTPYANIILQSGVIF